MGQLGYVGYLLLGTLLIYQGCVSIFICRAREYERLQRVLQLFVVWLIPLIGAIGCHLFLQSQRKNVPREDFRFVPQNPNDAGPMD